MVVLKGALLVPEPIAIYPVDQLALTWPSQVALTRSAPVA